MVGDTPTTFGSKDDAIAWLSARRAEIEMQVWAPEVAARGAVSRTVPTFHAYADVWVETRKTKGRELRPTTRRQYAMLLDKFIYPTFGETRIDKITTEDVNAWYDALAPGRETIRAQSYSLLRTIFASAASERPHPLGPCNPAHIRGAGNTKRAHHVQLPTSWVSRCSALRARAELARLRREGSRRTQTTSSEGLR